MGRPARPQISRRARCSRHRCAQQKCPLHGWTCAPNPPAWFRSIHCADARSRAVDHVGNSLSCVVGWIALAVLLTAACSPGNSIASERTQDTAAPGTVGHGDTAPDMITVHDRATATSPRRIAPAPGHPANYALRILRPPPTPGPSSFATPDVRRFYATDVRQCGLKGTACQSLLHLSNATSSANSVSTTAD